MPKFAPVSVIIPAYNAEATIGEALRSVLGQTLLPRQIVVVDDGSKDDTAARVGEVAVPEGLELVLVSQENGGVSAARNHGIKDSTQPWVAFLDADDVWERAKLADVMEALAKIPTAVMACHDFYRFGADGERFAVVAVGNVWRAGNTFEALYLRNFIGTSTVVARREVLEEAGLFEVGVSQGEDYSLWLRILDQHPRGLVGVPKVLSGWRDQAGSLSKRRWKVYRATMRMAKAFRPALERHSKCAGALYLKRLGLIHLQLVRP